MRLPIASPLVSRDGSANKDARLTNMLKEVDSGRELAVVRPGFEYAATGTGAGGGLVAFNNELISVYGTTLGVGSGAQYATWTKIGNAAIEQAVGSFTVSNGSTVFAKTTDSNSYYERSSTGVDWTPTSLGDYTQSIAVGDSLLSLYLSPSTTMLYRTDDQGQTNTLVSELPSTPGSFQYIFSVARSLYLVDADLGQSWVSLDMGASWTETFPSAPSTLNSNPPMTILVGSRMYVFDPTSGAYEYTDDYLNFTSGALSGAYCVGFYDSGNFIAYDPLTGDVLAIPESNMSLASVIGFVDPAIDINYSGQPFKIGNSAFIFGVDGVYRSDKPIDSLGTVASGIYDFAQGPL